MAESDDDPCLACSCENFPVTIDIRPALLQTGEKTGGSHGHFRENSRYGIRGEGYRDRRARHRLSPDGVRLDVRRTRDHGPRGLLDRQLARARAGPGHESPALPWSVRRTDRAGVL